MVERCLEIWYFDFGDCCYTVIVVLNMWYFHALYLVRC